MKSGKKVIRVALAILCMVSMLFISEYQKVEVYAASGYGFIFLSAYEKTLKTGDTYCLSVVSSGSKKPTFTSSDSKVASVNTYGKIRARFYHPADLAPWDTDWALRSVHRLQIRENR